MSASDESPQRLRVPRPGGDTARVVGVPLALAAVVASGHGWTSHDVRPGETLSGLAERYGTDVATLATRNAVQDADRIIAGHSLAVPAGDAARAAARAAHPAGRNWGHHPTALTYRVRAGDTVWDIARRAGTSVRAVLDANGLRASALIHPGQVLTLPRGAVRHLAGVSSSSSASSARTSGTAGSGSKTRRVVHVVRPGDTVWDVARRFGVPTATVLRANGLDAAAAIRPGRKLVLPGATPRRTPARVAERTRAHVVRSGETVTTIARRYGVSVQSVLRRNGLRSTSTIHPGRRLLVAGAGTTSRSTRPAGRQATPPKNVPKRRYSGAVTSAADANRAALGMRRAPTRAAARDLIRTAARRHGVEPALALAVANMESGFNQKQVSIANAIGIMQVIPSSGRWASQLVGRPLDLMDAEDNVEAGVALLAALLDRADERTAIAGYYQGLAGVRKNGMYPDTRRYVATVQALKARYR